MRNLLLALMAAFVAAGPLLAQTSGKTVNVSAASADITKVLQSIADQTNSTIVVAQGVVATVDVALRDVPLSSALTAVTKAAYLNWRRLMVPQGYTAADIRLAARAADAASRVNVLAAASGSQPAAAVFTGSVAEKASSFAAELGLREVYWVYSPDSSAASTASSSGTASAEEPSAAEAEPADEEEEQETASSVYQKAGASLSSLQPAEAYEVLQRLQNEVVAAMTPYEREEAMGGPPFLTEPERYHLGSGVSSVRMGNFGGPTVYRRVFRWPW